MDKKGTKGAWKPAVAIGLFGLGWVALATSEAARDPVGAMGFGAFWLFVSGVGLGVSWGGWVERQRTRPGSGSGSGKAARRMYLLPPIILLLGCAKPVAVSGAESSTPQPIEGMPGCTIQTITPFTVYEDGKRANHRSVTAIRCPGETVTTTARVPSGKTTVEQKVTVTEPARPDAIAGEVAP